MNEADAAEGCINREMSGYFCLRQCQLTTAKVVMQIRVTKLHIG
jgi:hypothetical protein